VHVERAFDFVASVEDVPERDPALSFETEK
jgi:hypothetical protein